MFEVIGQLVIWAVTIWAIFNSSKKKKKQRQQNYTGQMPQRTVQQKTPENMMAKQQELKQRLQQKYAGQMPQRTVQQKTPENMMAKQQELKQRLQQKYAGQMPQRTVQPTGQVWQEDILDKTSVKAEEYEADVPTQSFLMEEINDLMIMGYQVNLSFERDFIAEGVELLNNYEIS